MKINQDYLKQLLEACQASAGPTFDIEDLKAAGLDYNDELFEFHMMILTDQALIQRDDDEPGIGLQKSVDGFLSWAALPLRLTSSGHQFIEALSNEQVWSTIKGDFREASLPTLRAVSQRLLEAYSSSKVTHIVNNTTNIRTAINSPVQQSGAHSTQKQVTTYGLQERADIARLTSEMTSHLDELKLSAAAHQKANAQLATLQAQLSDEPNAVIVQEAGRTLRNITEGAIGGLISTAVQPTLWNWVAETMARLFS